MSLVIGSWTVDLSCVFFYFFSMSVLYVQLVVVVVVAVISRKKKGRKACADDVLSIGETFCCQDSFCAGRFKTTH